MTRITHFSRQIVFSLLAIVAVIATGQQAFAQSRTWLPSYDAAQHVYIDPSLTGFSLSNQFAGNIEQLAAKHNLNVVVIATVRGADITDSDRKRWAPEYLHTTAWRHLEGFSSFHEARSVVILFVKDGSTVSTGVRVGSAMHAVGLTRDVLNRTDGPVIPALRANMPAEPEAAFIAIAKNINGYLDARTTAKAPAASPSSNSSEDGGFGIGTILLIVGGGIVIVLLLRAIFSGGSSSGSSSSNSRSSGSTTNGREGSSRGADIATGAAIGGVLGSELARRNNAAPPPPAKKKKSSGGGDSGTTTGASSCGNASCGGGSGCGGGGCGGG